MQIRINLNLEYGKYKINSDLEGKTLRLKIKYSKTFKNGMFIIPREASIKILPKLGYESEYNFSVDNLNCNGKFNIEFRMFFSDNILQKYLEGNKKENEILDITILL